MPSSLVNLKQPVYQQSLVPVPGPEQQISLETFWYDNHTRTNSVKRVRPSDLFLNGTNFSVTEDGYYAGHCTSELDGVRYSGPSSWFHGASHAFSVPTSSSQLDYLRSAVDGRIRSKIKSQNVNLAQTLAEYRQACSMFSGAARDVISAFRSLRSGAAFADIVRILQNPSTPVTKRIANRWLEYQYGFRPLISDLYGVATELGSKLDSGIYRYVKSSNVDKQFASVKVSSGFYPFFPYTTVTTCVSSVRVRARYKIDSPALKRAAQIGFANPALLAWELIPYSFVVDWMIPVGDWLGSLDALAGVTELKVLAGYSVNAGSTITGVGRVDVWTRWKQRKAVINELSLPRLSYRPSHSLTAVLNGLALLRQLR